MRNMKSCTGCTACANCCPVDAISMHPDNLGFLYPYIDERKCVKCGKCDLVCKDATPVQIDAELQKVYSLRIRDDDELKASQSGGAFYVLAKQVLLKGGVVYGAALNKVFKVQHRRISSMEEINVLRRSKYVQSNLGESFKDVESDLDKGYFVLFSGTPCQVSGLYAFLRKKKCQLKNLLTVDLICHGVPSPLLWESYLSFLMKKNRDVILNVRFRDKSFGWASHVETIEMSKKSHSLTIFRDLFYSHLSVRESCSVCSYTNFNRVGDISIGDFWGYKSNEGEFADDKGISLVLLNTNKGSLFFDEIKSECFYYPSTRDACVQPQLVSPISLHPQRENFIRDFEKYGFKYVAKKYTPYGTQYKLKRILNKIFSKFRVSFIKIAEIILNRGNSYES